jgi:hypothetical protein
LRGCAGAEVVHGRPCPPSEPRRHRKRRATGLKVEGRKSYAERSPDVVRLAKRLHRYPVNGKRRSLRDVSTALAQAGFLASSGKPFGAAAIARMIDSPRLS